MQVHEADAGAKVCDTDKFARAGSDGVRSDGVGEDGRVLFPDHRRNNEEHAAWSAPWRKEGVAAGSDPVADKGAVHAGVRGRQDISLILVAWMGLCRLLDVFAQGGCGVEVDTWCGIEGSRVWKRLRRQAIGVVKLT
jgi:hypothetical protein